MNREWNYEVTNASDDNVDECMKAIKGRKSRFPKCIADRVWLRTECLIYKYVKVSGIENRSGVKLKFNSHIKLKKAHASNQS